VPPPATVKTQSAPSSSYSPYVGGGSTPPPTSSPAPYSNTYNPAGTGQPHGYGPATNVLPGTCIIPNCGKPVYVGRSGPSLFCSKKHGEDGVEMGLVKGCIMCRKAPKRQHDYFCSDKCKTTATTT
jgi:endogenous inhibitor of DNA gyrase (YacG/DUF329 family)